MSSHGKDSAEVIEFLAHFNRLKDWCDDDPEGLADLSSTDSSIEDLCKEMLMASHWLRKAEQGERSLFTMPVDPRFIDAWRDFEERYDSTVSFICLRSRHWFNGVLAQPSEIAASRRLWVNGNERGEAVSETIEAALEFSEHFSEELGGPGDDYLWDVLEERDPEPLGYAATTWAALKQTTGLDLAGVVRRRDLVPFVLVPRHVSNRFGNGKSASIWKNLQQAHDAYVFGVPYAAIALLRSILEVILRDHYRAAGSDLSQKIASVTSQLPTGVSARSLHGLRMKANSLLHLDNRDGAPISELDEFNLDIEIAGFMSVIRTLIERAPS